jgi:hypothetical protein
VQACNHVDNADVFEPSTAESDAAARDYGALVLPAASPTLTRYAPCPAAVSFVL